MLAGSANAFAVGEECAVLASSLNWSASPLGPPSAWPAALRHSFNICLEHPVATSVFWGPQLHMLYGDACIALLQDRHPRAFSRPAREILAEVWDVIGPQLQSVLDTGKPLIAASHRCALLHRTGSQKRYFSYAFTPIRDDQGCVRGVLNTVRETTAEVMAVMDRTRAQAALQQVTTASVQTRGLLQLLTDGTPDVIYVKDTSGRMVHVNNTVCRMFGRSRADIIGRTDTAWLPPRQAAAVMHNDQVVMSLRQTQTFEEEMRIVGDSSEPDLGDPASDSDLLGIENSSTESGHPEDVNIAQAQRHMWMVNRLYLATKSPWLSSDGKLLGMFCVARDITERKAQEDLLRQINESLEDMVAQRTLERDRIWRVSREIFVVAGQDGRFISVNPAFERVLGWAFEEAVAMPPLALVHRADAAISAREFARVLKGETVTGLHCRMRHRDGGYRWLNWTVVPEDALVYAVARDVTDEHTQADTLAKAEEQLRQAQKMEAVGQLTGGIAHDFNNLLATIMSSLELLQRKAGAGALQDMDRYVAAARTSAQRAASLTQRLLAFSRRQALDPRAVDVNALVGGMQELMHRTLGENIRLHTVLAPDLPPAFTDANQLESALLNLAINARDAMPQGGVLTISTALEQLAAASRRQDGKPAEYVTISTSDTGMGMAPKVIAKAFDPFFTTKPIGQGTGLGLSMIYGFAKQSGGDVCIESRPGQGTCVKLYLPRPGADQGPRNMVPSREPELPAPTPLGAGESILVVEDEAGVRMVVLEVLNELGYRTHEAVDATSALKLVESGIHLDLLVTDVGLPGTNGRQLAEMIRARRPGLQVLFITGYTGHAAIRADFLDAGMDMLAKPFLIDDLALKIESMLKSRASQNASVG
ncbi:MAG: domain S-box protein [Polaromonas sp.]|nr:domain S-box protein [Polaromonas sp.]